MEVGVIIRDEMGNFKGIVKAETGLSSKKKPFVVIGGKRIPLRSLTIPAQGSDLARDGGQGGPGIVVSDPVSVEMGAGNVFRQLVNILFLSVQY